jgi:hypothetical protein
MVNVTGGGIKGQLSFSLLNLRSNHQTQRWRLSREVLDREEGQVFIKSVHLCSSCCMQDPDWSLGAVGAKKRKSPLPCLADLSCPLFPDPGCLRPARLRVPNYFPKSLKPP